MAQDEDRVKGRGRPKNVEPGGTISAWIPASDQDELIHLAKARRQSVSSSVRDAVRIFLLEKSGSRHSGSE
jgi:hypothetical protein